MRTSRTGFVLASVLAVGVSLAVPAAASADASGTGVANRNERVCATPAAGQGACNLIVHLAGGGGSGHGHKPGSGSTPPPVSYDASDLQAAYGVSDLVGTAGVGHTVAIVDAYDDPNALADVNTYRAGNGLGDLVACDGANPATSSAHPCLSQVNQRGELGAPPKPDTGWAQEISVDLDMVSALCPRCDVLLVEADSASLSDLGAAVNTAAGFDPVAIGNSYGGGEYAGEAADSSTYYSHPGIAITAAAGDNGYGVEFPAAAPDVIAVGGTSMRITDGVVSETVWSGTGSGCSAYIAKPAWQHDTGCAHRTVADVAAVADPNTGVQAVDTYNEPGAMVFGGTSVSTQIIAALYGLVGHGESDAQTFYGGNGLRDVTSGSNGSCTGHGRNADPSLQYLCTGEPGYDGPTGLGSPAGLGAF